MKTILTVCWGNIFRSVVTEQVINKRLNELGIDKKVKCISRGIQGQNNIPAPKFESFPEYTDEYNLAKPILEVSGLNIDHHTYQPIDQEIIMTSDLIIVMDQKVAYDEQVGILVVYPTVADKTIFIGDYINQEGGIADPAENTDVNKYVKIIPEIILSVEKMSPLLLELSEREEHDREIKNDIKPFIKRKENE